MPNIAILMYHRICEKTKHNKCYFARGTAVEPQVFERQLNWLIKEGYTFTSLTKAVELSKQKEEGKYCVLTFDDGYKEIKDVVWPLSKNLQIPICIFPIAGHTAEADFPVYVDHYYMILHYANNRSPIHLKFLDVDMQVPAIDTDIQWWIKGEFKEKLHMATAEEQIILLQNLKQVLDSQIPIDLPQNLYLSREDISSLHKDGVEVGGHGYYHRRLAEIGQEELNFEISASLKLLLDIGVTKPELFCYPDGSYSSKVIEHLHKYGFATACTVNKGFYNPDTSQMEVPRIFVRNIEPGHPSWLREYSILL
ncbi:polysaccharide deacetylase family protein [Candidatus Uabimicrobium amorphum]|uniref:Polysaccharide deacetylase n=1 Tax=Uabimicrobium amorphum TaxID=2596890 RepID=A0A5S9IS22_UABAM|nr:polysaccharide deacetylase family protein [Candidatus Uabimicrobium amorphum]BBM87108.1 polysaccharide deacetylase [Candidatus Uabimicrobium amorphum]